MSSPSKQSFSRDAHSNAFDGNPPKKNPSLDIPQTMLILAVDILTLPSHW